MKKKNPLEPTLSGDAELMPSFARYRKNLAQI